MQLGVNVTMQAPWATDESWPDLMKGGLPWVSGTIGVNWSDGRPLNLDGHGNVLSLLDGQCARTQILQRPHKTGTYKITWQGQGTLGCSCGEVTARTANSMTVRADAGICLDLEATDPADPVRKIKIPSPHRKQALTDLAPFRVLRYMEAQGTNNSPVTTAWPKLSDQLWPFERGVPMPAIKAHSTRYGTRPWVCVPHQATDGLVKGMARALKGVRPIVEYSNELGNTAPDFGQCHWAAAQPGALGATERERALHFGATRTAQIAALWRAIDPDVTVVYGIDDTVPHMADMAVRSGADAVCGGGYLGIEANWGPGFPPSDWTVDGLLEWLSGPSMARYADWLGNRKAVADEVGVPLYVYEGGFHIREGEHVHALYLDSRIKEVATALLDTAEAAGVDLFCWYSYASPLEGGNVFGANRWTGAGDPRWQALRDWGV